VSEYIFINSSYFILIEPFLTQTNPKKGLINTPNLGKKSLKTKYL
jgi:hypothetical protein